jgi:acyl carrier protein
MRREDILSELKVLIGEYISADEKVKLETITDDTNFTTDLNMDSVDLVDIVINAETKFVITIENENIGKMITVGKCLDIIEEKLKSK